MALPERSVQIDKILVGYSPRFTGVQALTKVRDGDGILVAVTLQIAAGAGGTIQFFTDAGGAQPITGVIDTTKGPITLWVYQSFTGGLWMTIGVAATDALVVTGGI